jgi:hypothetical protein
MHIHPSSQSKLPCHNVGNIGVLVCDFDETLTEKDTIGTLLSVAEEVAARVSTSSLQVAH